jgi:hypothetical protein
MSLIPFAPFTQGYGQQTVKGQRLDSKVFQERSMLQVIRVKRIALAEIACLVAAAEPADALFGTAMRK